MNNALQSESLSVIQLPSSCSEQGLFLVLSDSAPTEGC